MGKKKRGGNKKKGGGGGVKKQQSSSSSSTPTPTPNTNCVESNSNGNIGSGIDGGGAPPPEPIKKQYCGGRRVIIQEATEGDDIIDKSTTKTNDVVVDSSTTIDEDDKKDSANIISDCYIKESENSSTPVNKAKGNGDIISNNTDNNNNNKEEEVNEDEQNNTIVSINNEIDDSKEDATEPTKSIIGVDDDEANKAGSDEGAVEYDNNAGNENKKEVIGSTDIIYEAAIEDKKETTMNDDGQDPTLSMDESEADTSSPTDETLDNEKSQNEIIETSTKESEEVPTTTSNEAEDGDATKDIMVEKVDVLVALTSKSNEEESTKEDKPSKKIDENRNEVDESNGELPSLQSNNESAPMPLGVEEEVQGSPFNNETLQLAKSYSDEDNLLSSQSSARDVVRNLSSTLSSSMEEVDLDTSEENILQSSTKHSNPSPPLVRAYNGTLPNNSIISPATQNSLSFTFHDAYEKDAFDFLTTSLRERLSNNTIVDNVSDEVLCRYIRWKPDVKRAAERYRAYETFRKENSYIFDNEKEGSILLSQDPKLLYLIQCGMVIAPEELVAKDGSSVMILRGSKCNNASAKHNHDEDGKSASRAIFYVLQKCILERHTFDPSKGITIILDLSGVTRRNIPKKLSTLLSKAAGCFPIRIKSIYIVSMPWWFPYGSIMKLFSSSKIRTSRIHYLKNKVDLTKYIDEDRLLEEDGGIYHFDLKEWVSSIVLREVDEMGISRDNK